MRKVNEIFYSIQGEGYFTGTPAVFIRFSGCNLDCDFCDTEHQSGVMMSDKEIINEIIQYPARHVVLTGGEPSLHISHEFVDRLKKNGFFVQIETNGTRELPANIDWITCSPKAGGETVILNPHELKVVFTGQEMSQYDCFNAQVFCLQPCSGKNTEKVIEYILAHPKWRLSLQTHKLLNVR
ncbi:7-carboxy-7-deazaguanine synthase QueE [Bacteroides sedimenti]|uniref:7-carboxy-7-deazaguanine synthase n=1 Tax=Bacteroides sedimenti TaxID=2136147 RepID=A0ABM8I945_9BACE